MIRKDTFSKKLRRTSQTASGKDWSPYLSIRATRVCNFCQFLSSASGERIGFFLAQIETSRGTKTRFISPRYIVANRRDTKKRIIPFVKHRDSGIRGDAPRGRQVLVSWYITSFPRRASRLKIRAERCFSRSVTLLTLCHMAFRTWHMLRICYILFSCLFLYTT